MGNIPLEMIEVAEFCGSGQRLGFHTGKYTAKFNALWDGLLSHRGSKGCKKHVALNEHVDEGSEGKILDKSRYLRGEVRGKKWGVREV